MPITDNIRKYECDRCGSVAYSTDVPTPSFQIVQRYNADSILQHFILCADCSKKYRAMMDQWDTDYSKFMDRKETQA